MDSIIEGPSSRFQSLVHTEKTQQQPLENKKSKFDAMKLCSSLFSKLTNDDETVQARILLLIAAALYGTNFTFVKMLGETDLSLGLSSTLRFGLAFIVTLPWLLQLNSTTDIDGAKEDVNGEGITNQQEEIDLYSRIQTLTDPSGVEWKSTMAGLEVGIWVATGYISQAIGLESMQASKSAFLCSLAVVVVPILDILIGKKLQSRQIVGSLLAVIGVGFLEFTGSGSSDAVAVIAENNGILPGVSLSFGEICSLIQPLAFGMGFWRMENAMHLYPTQANRLTAAQLTTVFLGSLVYYASTSIASIDAIGNTVSIDAIALSIFSEVGSIPSTVLSDPTIFFSLLWCGIITTALTVYLETVALKTLSAAETTIIFSTEPLWGTACAVALMGEILELNSVIGASFIIAACIFSNLGLDGLSSLLQQKKKDDGTAIIAHDKETNIIFNLEEDLSLLPDWSEEEESILTQGNTYNDIGDVGISP